MSVTANVAMHECYCKRGRGRFWPVKLPSAQGLADYSPTNSRTGFEVRYGSYSKKETKQSFYIFSLQQKKLGR